MYLNETKTINTFATALGDNQRYLGFQFKFGRGRMSEGRGDVVSIYGQQKSRFVMRDNDRVNIKTRSAGILLAPA